MSKEFITINGFIKEPIVYELPTSPVYDEVITYSKSYLSEEMKEKIRYELTTKKSNSFDPCYVGYYNSDWKEILKCFRVDESFLREILDYISISYLKCFQDDLSENFKREFWNHI